MKIDTRNAKHWWLLLLQAAWSALAILLRPFASKPQKPVVIFYGHQFAGNLKALYIEWQKHYQDRLEVYFLTLDPAQFEHLKASGIQALACHRWRDMRKLTRASVMVTDHGLHAMSALSRFTDIVFIDVWHGIPFKGFVPEDFRLQQNYDEVWVPSALISTLYSTRFGFDADRLHSLGYARTDKLFRKESAESGFRENFGISSQKKVVLYAPTWQQKANEPPPTVFGNDNSVFIEQLGEICAAHGALLVNRCHLNTRIEHSGSDDVLYVPQKLYPDTEEILMAADILVCDWSSVAFDFATLDRPTLFLDIPPPFHNGLSLGKEYRFGAIIESMAELENRLIAYLADPGAYQRDFGEKQGRIVHELYARESIGRAGEIQLDRLVELTR